MVNLYLDKTITKNLEAFIGIGNIFNAKYKKVLGYPIPPFNVSVCGKAKF